MEQKRTWLRVICHEEEEEEDWDRRISPRNRKRVRYVEDVDYDEEEEKDEEDNEQPGPSTQNIHNQRTQEKRSLPVTCGNKKGILDVEKLGRGEVCIKCEGCWFSPPAFEELGGKGCSKKWKVSIFYENKPLQFWFEQGSLTTKGFKRRATATTQQKKNLSSNHTSESPTRESEIQSAEETQEDVGIDEDWLPGSEELALEKEEGKEERVGAENGREVVDSEVDKSEEEENQMERGMEDQDLPAVADKDRDNCVNEEKETELMISTSEKIRESVLQKQVKVIIQRLPEFQVNSDCESSCMGPPVVGSWCTPCDRDAQNEAGHNGTAADDPSTTAATHIGPLQMSCPPIAGGVGKENGEEVTQSNERENVEQREIKTEAGNSPAPVTDTDFIGDMIDEWEEKEGTGRCGEEEERRRGGMVTETQIRWTEGFKNEDLDMAASEAGGQPLASGHISDVPSNTPPIHSSIKEERIEAMSDMLVESGHDGVGLQVLKLETGVPQETQGSGSTPSSDMVEDPSTSWPSTSCNLDTMDIDQLRREKIKLQIKVLKLQEEYYTQKIKGQKQ
ncbi:uncharacterized protein LOC119885607 isoform X1 [Micropterus salmoides]|uniref:uncharacterized protein LOC119885607 isoform X1 n=1 Tax=Micropterus salmoides TaxID=27706 RepID=UPI0018EABACC|nr:uncharacterized protein LOC119885607 isoform X1 [Micropterus salmoides]XP_038551652.1 uncharacterized protein LOC119885607 isoform X1 [Micropterus salmoides]